MAENERNARGLFEWDPELQREGHYALLLAILRGLRPEGAFALLRGEAMPELTAEDCADIRRMRRRSLRYDAADRSLCDGEGLRWKQLEQMYGCSTVALKAACAAGRKPER